MSPGRSTGFLPVKIRPPGDTAQPAALLISPDALASVRFGLRAADDPRIVATVHAIDGMLKVELAQGPLWYRYNHNGYGEHDDVSPFDGTAMGRAWPLLAGERRAARRSPRCGDRTAGDPGGVCRAWRAPARAELGRTRHFRAQAVPGPAVRPCDAAGLGACPAFQAAPLTPGRPGIRHAAAAGAPLPGGPGDRTGPRLADDQELRRLPPGKILRNEPASAAEVHRNSDDWATTTCQPTLAIGFGLHVADLAPPEGGYGAELCFSFRPVEADTREATDFAVLVDDDAVARPPDVAQARAEAATPGA